MHFCLVFLELVKSVFPTPMPTASPNPRTSSSIALTAGAAGGAVAVFASLVVVVVFILCCCGCIRSETDPEGKRTRHFNWNLHRDVENGEIPIIQMPPSTGPGHVSPSKRFHAKDTPEYRRQNTTNNGSRNNSLDLPEEPFYNGGSMISQTSGISALSDEDEAMSCPPSPAVSDYERGEEGDKIQHGPSISVDDELISYKYDKPHSPTTKLFEVQDGASDHHKHLRIMPTDQPKHVAPSNRLAQERSVSPHQTKHTMPVSDNLVEGKGSSSSHKSHTQDHDSEYLKLPQYTASDSGYTGSGARASQNITVSTTRPQDPLTTRGNRQRAWSPTSCLSDFTNYEILYEMYRSQITPECVKPTATLSECTNKGVKYYDEANDFSLEIPEGAIPEGETVTIDIGVALYGPFQYPEGLRPVSPVFWLCVRDKKFFHFLRPVTVTIPHFLDLENHNDIESLGLTFLKGDHEMNSQQMYQFQQAEGNVLFEPLKKHGVLQTTHFCYLCISSKISLKMIRKAMFCVYAAIPRAMSPREPAYVYFFITFLLSTCRDTLKNQISKIPELHNHITKTQDFKFLKRTRDPALGIILSPSTPPEWTVGLQFNKEVNIIHFLY